MKLFRSRWLGLGVMAGLVVGIWLPMALATGFVFEDWGFLALSRDGAQAGLGVWDSVMGVSSGRPSFRPLGCGAWFVCVERGLGASRWGAAVVALGFFAGMLGIWAWAWRCWWRVGRGGNSGAAGARRRWLDRAAAAVAVGVIGMHPAWMLPAIWTSAAAETLALGFGGLAVGLLGWMVGGGTGGMGGSGARPSGLGPHGMRWLAAAGVVAGLGGAYLCKENAVVLPVVLGGLLLVHRGGAGGRGAVDRRGGLLAWAAVVVGGALAGVWLLMRGQYAIPIAPGNPYELVAGANVLRNGAALVAYGVGVPREALRLVVEERSGAGAAWGVGLALLTVGAWLGGGMVRRGGGWRRFRRDLGRPGSGRAWVALAVVLVPLAPYVGLRWNSYAYYVVPALLVAGLLAGGRFWRRVGWRGLLLAGTANLVMQGGMLLLVPARMSLPERSWQSADDQAALGDLSGTVQGRGVIRVRFADEARGAALGGLRGVAWGLGVPVEKVANAATGRTDSDRPVAPGSVDLVVDGFGVSRPVR